MAVEDNDDRGTMLADFGASVTWNTTDTITVVFDDAYVLDSVGQGAGAESTAPAVLAKSSDVSAAVHGTPLVYGGTTYHVIGIEPDGQGMTRLVLEKQ